MDRQPQDAGVKSVAYAGLVRDSGLRFYRMFTREDYGGKRLLYEMKNLKFCGKINEVFLSLDVGNTCPSGRLRLQAWVS